MRGAVCVVLGAMLPLEAQQRPAPMPLTQLDERAPSADLDNRTLSLTFAQPVQLRDLLLLLVRSTALSVVPDPTVTGTFIGELKNVTVRQALALILQAQGFDFSVDGSVVRVFKRGTETRIFDINYIATLRSGESLVGADSGARSHADVASSTHTDLFGDLATGVKALLSERGIFNLDRKAGLLQVTDFSERLERVAVYLEAVDDRVHRQVQVDALLVEVELNDPKANGVDWSVVAAQLRGTTTAAERTAPRPSLTGLRVTDTSKLLSLLAAQGAVSTVAMPSLLAMNNEPAIVRTDALTISVTPQIGTDGALMLSVIPILTLPAPRESDVLARVADGETLVFAGATRDREVRERKNPGQGGGWFGRGTVVTRRKTELVILLTPHVVIGVNAQ